MTKPTKQPEKTKKSREKMKYDDVLVIKGKVEVFMTNEKGQTIGRTELLLTDVWIKIPTMLK